MNISSFLSTVSQAGGLARPTKYAVFIPAIANGFGDTDRLQKFCAHAELPGYQFQLDVNRTYGVTWKFPHMPEYAETTMTFYVGADMAERTFFEQWMYNVMNPLTNDFNYIAEYAQPIVIAQYNDGDELAYSTKLIDAYPIAIGALALAWDAVDQVHKMDVTFTYKFAIPFEGKDSTSGAGINGQQNFHNALSFNPASTLLGAGVKKDLSIKADGALSPIK